VGRAEKLTQGIASTAPVARLKLLLSGCGVTKRKAAPTQRLEHSIVSHHSPPKATKSMRGDCTLSFLTTSIKLDIVPTNFL